MGYETDFEVQICDAATGEIQWGALDIILRKLKSPDTDAARRLEGTLRGYTTLIDIIEYLAGNNGTGKLKWYKHKEDFIYLSKLFPDYHFKVEGHGDDRDDNWIAEFLHGKAKRKMFAKPILTHVPWGDWEEDR